MPNPVAFFEGLTTMQLVLGIAGLFVGLFLVKTIFTPGGPRHRMKGNSAVWLMIPLVLAAGGALAWVVYRLIEMRGGNFFIT